MEPELPIVSVIMSVYNGERCLEKAIKSVLNQTSQNFEFILIDDGSTDSSGKIGDDYACKDSRIKVIHQSNGGVSSARNAGIRNATGQYIQFIDSDDYMDADMCSILVEAMKTNDADLVICGYQNVSESTVDANRYPPKKFNTILDMENDFSDLYRRAFLNPPWNKLYKKEKIITYFDENLSMGEDLLFNLSYLKQCACVAVIEETPYHYVRAQAGTLTTSYRKDLFEIQVLLHQEILGFIQTHFSENMDMGKININFIKNIQDSIVKLTTCSNLSQKEILSKLRSWVKNPLVHNASKIMQPDSLQTKINYFLINHKLATVIYIYLKTKMRFMHKTN